MFYPSQSAAILIFPGEEKKNKTKKHPVQTITLLSVISSSTSCSSHESSTPDSPPVSVHPTWSSGWKGGTPPKTWPSKLVWEDPVAVAQPDPPPLKTFLYAMFCRCPSVLSVRLGCRGTVQCRARSSAPFSCILQLDVYDEI